MSGMTKAERLSEMKRLYVQRAFTDIEMAERLGVDRTTVYRDRMELTGEYPIEQDAEGRYHIDRAKLISEIKVNLHEALSLYLAARKASRQTRFHQPHAASALEKLATALRQPMTERLLKTADALLKQEKGSERVKILETVTQAWAEQRKLRIRYQPLGLDEFRNHTIHPYLIEPSIWSDSVYVIAYSEETEKITPFKVERIDTAMLRGENFSLPDAFDEQEMLRHAWGIWFKDNPPITVKLRFSPRVVRRLKESIWHPLEIVTDQEDGSCLWIAEVAEWREMLPWIRGWGADCEVLEPESLHKALEREARRMARVYKISGTPEIPVYQLLWAKTDEQKTTTHPLIGHMIDVAMCAMALWKEVLPDGIRVRLASPLGLESDLDNAGRILAFWAGLHDLGKASPCFQMKYPPVIPLLEQKGLDFSPRLDKKDKCLHGHISAKMLLPLLVNETCLPQDWAEKVARAIGGHHGTWPDRLSDFANSTLAGKEAWEKVRRQLFLRLKEMVDPSIFRPPELSTVESNAFFTLFSGFVSVADWLGSMEEYFEPHSGYVDLEKYTEHAKNRAEKVLKENGWLGWKPPLAAVDITALCDIPSARPLQSAVVTLAKILDRPGLVLIEAPTGEGKTEAAIYLADHWAQKLQQRGAYIAMPTMATSNQMYGRIAKILKRRYQDGTFLSYHLLHGNALLQENDNIPKLSKVYETSGNLGAASWFTKRKRGLLAPFAVGTVDQALLSILQTPHFFVRLFGLSGKTIIFDEVHAYDTYMDALFFHLLSWLRVVGASVVILSATLPEATRRNILQAYSGQTFENLPPAPYPAITWTISSQPETISFQASAPRILEIEKIGRDPQQIADILEKELKDGGYAAMICNTVGRAQEVYRVLNQRNIVPEQDLYLFHARFPFDGRQEIEKTVTNIFDNHAPDDLPRQKRIVVATQVIEQSLDLDFDLMISDLAPVDLILQRAGRLHRNPQRQNRPVNLQKPRFLIAIPELENGVPKLDQSDTFVYEKYFLLRSYLALKGNIEIPNQTRELLESVYGAEDRMPHLPSPEYQEALLRSLQKMKENRRESEFEAQKKLIQPANSPELLTTPITRLDEDNPELHKFLRAATRLAPSSVTLICLHRTPNGLVLDPGLGSPIINLEIEPDFSLTCLLMGRKVEVTNHELVEYFGQSVSSPKGWKESTWLRHARCVEFEGGIFQPKDKPWQLILDRKLGLVFDKGA